MIFFDENGKIPFVIISGISGTGKDWVVQRLTDKRFKQVKTYTTRAKRSDKDFYNFVSDEEMDKLFPTFCQKFESGGARYGCSETDIMDIVQTGKIPILIASPSAAMDMFFGLGEAVKRYSIYYVHIDAHPDEAFYNLTTYRKSSPEELIKRIFDMDIKITESYQKFLEEDSYEFIKGGFNEFDTVSNSLEALEVIIRKYYLGVEEEI